MLEHSVIIILGMMNGLLCGALYHSRKTNIALKQMVIIEQSLMDNIMELGGQGLVDLLRDDCAKQLDDDPGLREWVGNAGDELNDVLKRVGIDPVTLKPEPVLNEWAWAVLEQKSQRCDDCQETIRVGEIAWSKETTAGLGSHTVIICEVCHDNRAGA